jgi:hypothetical protein
MLNISNSEGQTLGAAPCGHYASGKLLSPMDLVMVGAQLISGRPENFFTAVHQAWAVEAGGASGYGGAVAVMVAVVADQITNQ